MVGTAVVIGGTGQVGRATVAALLHDGWRVRVISRGGRSVDAMPADVPIAAADRDDAAAMATALGDGCDVLVDCVAFHAGHARQLVALSDRIGSAVVLSSAAVYTDDAGHTFGGEPWPRYPVPVREDQPTVEPGGTGYANRKVALEQALLAAADRLPVTLLRAGAIHGPSATAPREWYFVKRALDKRPVRVLAYRGDSRFQPVSTVNMAELIRLAAARPGTRVLNAADPDAPTVREIGASIDAVLGHQAQDVPLDGPPTEFGVGATPWSIPEPLVLDMAATAKRLGYQPVTDYAGALPRTVSWLIDTTRDRDWRQVLPGLARQCEELDFFNYSAEDAWLDGLQG